MVAEAGAGVAGESLAGIPRGGEAQKGLGRVLARFGGYFCLVVIGEPSA